MRLFPAVLLIGTSLAVTMPVAASEIQLSDAQLDNVTAGNRFERSVGSQRNQIRIILPGDTQSQPNDNAGNTNSANVLRSEDGPNVASIELRNGDSGLAILTRAEGLSGFGFASLDIRIIDDQVRSLSIRSGDIRATVSD